MGERSIVPSHRAKEHHGPSVQSRMVAHSTSGFRAPFREVSILGVQGADPTSRARDLVVSDPRLNIVSANSTTLFPEYLGTLEV